MMTPTIQPLSSVRMMFVIWPALLNLMASIKPTTAAGEK